jgi:peptide/nickel transport system substrate-binding protein
VAPTQAQAAAPTVAPSATSAPAVIGPKYGGKLTWAIEQDPAHIAPFGATNTSNHFGKEFMYESLVKWDRDLLFQPSLAESWETPDENTYIWHLRKGVKFHNGEEFKADSVIYSMDMQSHPPEPGNPQKNSRYPAILEPILENVVALDEYTVKFNMERVDPTVLGWMAWERYSAMIPNDAYGRWNLVTEGIGTGPFKLVTYVPNDRLEYVKFEDYWDPQYPYVDELLLKVLPDEGSRVAAIRSGAIDGGFIEADSVAVLKNDPNITVLKGPYSAPRVLQFTLKNEGKPWEDKRVRQAISFAINRQDVMDKVFAGEATLSGPIPPGYGDWFIPPEELAQKWLRYDLDEAKRLMEEAGYKDGFAIELQAIANHDASLTAEVIKEQLKALNIEVNVVSLEIGTFSDHNRAGSYEWQSTERGMRHDVTGYLNDFGDIPEDDAWFAGPNGIGYWNQELVDLYMDLRVTLDQKLRHEQARRIQELVLEDVPHVYVCQPYRFHAVRSNLKDMYVAFTAFYTGLETAWLEA